MKVIEQLVTYLRQSGRLTPEQLRYLQVHGYCAVTAGAEPAPETVPALAPTPSPDPSTLAWQQDSDDPYLPDDALALPRRAAIRPRQGRAATRRARKWGAHAALAAHLRRCMPTWAEPLDGLVALARRLGPASTWQEAACCLRNAADGALGRALAKALDARQPPLPGLWTALTFEGYLDLQGLPRSARHACHVWLEVAARGASGGAVRLPRGPDVAAVCNLVRAQRRLLAACGRLDRDQPRLLARALQRDHDPDACLALRLVRAGRAGGPMAGWPAVDPHCPRRPLPCGEICERARKHALYLDADHVLPSFGTLVGGPPLGALGRAAAALQDWGDWISESGPVRPAAVWDDLPDQSVAFDVPDPQSIDGKEDE